jgi:hypothetical protein
MSDLDLERLRSIAQAATPGPWYWNGEDQMVTMSPGDSGDMRWDWNGEKGRTVPPTTIIETDSGHYPPRENDRAHIAAFSPSVCLRLIQEIQRQPKMWECPECAFTFDAIHTDADGGHSCPCCAESSLRRSALEEAARLVCLGCEEGVKRITDPVTGDSFHDHGPPHRGADCEASPIWLAINGLIEGETK